MLIIWLLMLVATADISVHAQGSSAVFETLPILRGNVLVTGYSGLQLTTQIQNPENICQWRYGDMEFNILTPAFSCQNQSKIGDDNFVITCVQNNALVSTSLIVTIPLQRSVNIRVQCRDNFIDEINVISSLSLNVTDCATSSSLAVASASATYNSNGTFRCTNNENLYYRNGTQATAPQTTCLLTAKWSGEENVECFKGCNVTYPLVVVSDSTFYNSSGTFSCANNGTLFYSNGTQLTSTQTTCLATAEWSGQNETECWAAPNVTLEGTFSATEGTELRISCVYTDVYPNGNNSTFYFRSKEIVKQKNEPFSFTAQRTDDRNPISCQATTPYTQVFNETGRSQIVFLDVQHRPYQESLAACNWIVDEKGICSFSFTSNPKSSFVSLKKNGTTITPSNSNISVQDQVQAFSFTKNSVALDDEGYYSLLLHSTTFGNTSLFFYVKVTAFIPAVPQPTLLNIILFVSAGIGGLAVMTSVVLLVMLVKRGRNKNKHVGHLRSGSQVTFAADANQPDDDQDENGYLKISVLHTGKSKQGKKNKHEHSQHIEEGKDGYLKVNLPGPSKQERKSENAQHIEEDQNGYLKVNVAGQVEEDQNGYVKLAADTKERKSENAQRIEEDQNGYLKVNVAGQVEEDQNGYVKLTADTMKATDHDHQENFIQPANHVYEKMKVPKPSTSRKEDYVHMTASVPVVTRNQD